MPHIDALELEEKLLEEDEAYIGPEPRILDDATYAVGPSPPGTPREQIVKPLKIRISKDADEVWLFPVDLEHGNRKSPGRPTVFGFRTLFSKRYHERFGRGPTMQLASNAWETYQRAKPGVVVLRAQ